MRARAVALFCGLLFGSGLIISGMTRPDKVIGFLDVLGGWDPSLAFVLAGATGTHMLLRPVTRRLAPQMVVQGTPATVAVDRELLGGAALFGVGWGLGGYCPGPALASAAPALESTALFLVPMLVGMGLHTAYARWQSQPPSQGGTTQPA